MVYLQDAEYIKQASEAWDETIRIAESTSGWEIVDNDEFDAMQC